MKWFSLCASTLTFLHNFGVGKRRGNCQSLPFSSCRSTGSLCKGQWSQQDLLNLETPKLDREMSHYSRMDKSRGRGSSLSPEAVASDQSVAPNKPQGKWYKSDFLRVQRPQKLSFPWKVLTPLEKGSYLNFSFEMYTLWRDLCHILSSLSKTPWRKLGRILA